MTKYRAADSIEVTPATYRWFPGLALSDFEVWAPIAEKHGAVAVDFDNYGDLEPAVLLTLPRGCWWTIETPTSTHGVHASKQAYGAPLEGTSFVALCSSETQLSSFGDLYAPWEHAPETTLEGTLTRKEQHWQLGEIRAGVHPLLVTGLRDWLWSFGKNRTISSLFAVNFTSQANEAVEWIARCAPLPYFSTPTGGRNPPTGNGTSSMEALSHGLSFWRDWSDVLPGQSEMESSLLWLIANGALPISSWQCTDLDYGFVSATGDDAASLRSYLDPKTDEHTLLAQYRTLLAPKHIHAENARTKEAFLTTVLIALGAPTTMNFTPETSEAWLRSQPLSSLPRRLTIFSNYAFHTDPGFEWWFALLRRAQPRMHSTVQ